MTEFVKIGETVHHQGRMVRMSTVHFRAPDGSTFDRDFVHHPGAVAVVPLLADHRVLLVRQYRTPLGRETLELPAGVCDKEGEARVEAARRELEEEAGLVPGAIEELLTIHTGPGFTDEEITLYLATELVETARAADGVEEQHMVSEIIDLADLDDLTSSGAISDAKTVLALMMVRDRLR